MICTQERLFYPACVTAVTAHTCNNRQPGKDSTYGADIRPQLQRLGSREPGLDGADRDRSGGYAGSVAALALGDAARPAAGAASALQP